MWEVVLIVGMFEGVTLSFLANPRRVVVINKLNLLILRNIANNLYSFSHVIYNIKV